MVCFYPMRAYRVEGVNPSTGKHRIVFNPMVKDGRVLEEVMLPCGQCIGCRLERSRQWAIRCVHEASMYDDNSFLTLTYDSEHLPKDGSLNLRDVQNFLKRFRKYVYPNKIRFFQCGEYGETYGRPHHHMIVFGYDFQDKELFGYVGDSRRNNPIFTSDILSSLWPFGYSSIGDVTFESCAYVARYVTKKFFGKGADEYYQGRRPEYVTMSRRPGIGAAWLQKYASDVYNQDKCIIRGNKSCRPPKYYDKVVNEMYPEIDIEQIKALRRENSKNSDMFSTKGVDCDVVYDEPLYDWKRAKSKDEYKKLVISKSLVRKFESEL